MGFERAFTKAGGLRCMAASAAAAASNASCGVIGAGGSVMGWVVALTKGGGLRFFAASIAAILPQNCRGQRGSTDDNREADSRLSRTIRAEAARLGKPLRGA